MKRAKWIFAAILAIAAAVVLLPGHLGLPPLASKQLVVKASGEQQPSSPIENWVARDLAESPQSESLAHFALSAAPIGPGLYTLSTALSHDEDNRIESMRITFRIPFGEGQVALVTPEGSPWNDPRFGRDPNTGDISFVVDRLGSMGGGSIFNEFIYRQQAHSPGGTTTFTVQATFSLRGNHFLQLAGSKAEAEIEVNLPAQQPSSESASEPSSLARPYTVIGRLNMAVTTDERSFGLWQITSGAKTRGEWAQTAKQAALDLHKQYGADYTAVLLTPDEHITEIAYAQVGYAADGKGTLGLDGADLTSFEWDVRVVDRPLTVEECAIADLWEQKSAAFPSADPLSSSSYDEDALREYIAETLNIDYERVKRPTLVPKKYEGTY
jgi:hypothetical protein